MITIYSPTADDFPTLAPGANILSWTGTGVTGITITPRWRDL